MEQHFFFSDFTQQEVCPPPPPPPPPFRLKYRNKGGDNYNCAYATPVNFHVFMKYVAPTKFTHKSA